MELVSSAYHVVSAAAIFLAGACVSVFLGRSFFISTSESLLLYIWHTLFCVLYCVYSLSDGGDAIGYFINGRDWSGELSVGGSFIRALSALLVSGFELSILGVFFVFNIFGQIGLLSFWGSLKVAVVGKSLSIRILSTLIIFLPSVSFWSSALGKDALSFMAIGLALWASLRLKDRKVLMVMAIAIMFFVRPHIAAIMMSALAIASMVDVNISLGKRMLLGVVAAASASLLIPFAIQYAGVGDVVTIESLSDYVEARQSYNQKGDGGINISEMSLPVQLFTYLLRPLLFEAHSVFALAAAIDNSILFLIIVIGFASILRGNRSKLDDNRVFLWAYVLCSWVVLSVTTANLGIAMRQKWMFLPMLIFLLLSVVGNSDVSKAKGRF